MTKASFTLTSEMFSELASMDQAVELVAALELTPELVQSDTEYGQLRGFEQLQAATIIRSYDQGRRDFSHLDLRGVQLASARLSGADFSNANLSEAALAGADLARTNLASANLSGSDLTNVRLSAANLSHANLARANLTNANLFEANVLEADFSDAKLTGARTDNSVLSPPGHQPGMPNRESRPSSLAASGTRADRVATQIFRARGHESAHEVASGASVAGLRVFDIHEVNALIPSLSNLVGEQLRLQSEIEHGLAELSRQLGTFPVTLEVGNADPEPIRKLKRRVRHHIEVYEERWAKVQELGGVIKDPQTGLVDFYGRFGGRFVWLCWRYGEESVQSYHELDAGFSGRRPLRETIVKRRLN